MMNCTLCSRDDRAVIEGVIRDNNTSLRAIAGMFGLSKDAVHRHKVNHMIASNGATAAGAADDHNGDKRNAQLEPVVDRYRAFVARFRGKRISRAEVATWGYDPQELEVFVKVALKRGDLSSS